MAGCNPVDALVLQETKLTDDKFPTSDFRAAGWQVQWFGQKTHNGVALISREVASAIQKNIPGFADEQARVIAGTVAGVRVVGGYFLRTARHRTATSSSTRCAGWTRCTTGWLLSRKRIQTWC